MPVWLPLLLAALAVLAIYLIRPTAQTLSVASTLLWRRLLAARRKRHDRLRWLLSLLLAMTVAGCLALAAGQAPWLQPGGGDLIALAFDSSPTMRAALPGGAGTRMELAIAEARRTIAEADSGSRFTLGADPTPLTSAEALLALSGAVEPEAVEADLEPAIPSGDAAYLFTDGISDWRPITDPATETRTVSVLAPARNAGIVLFVTRPAPSHEAKPEALLEVLATDSADASSPLRTELTVADSETIRIRRQLELPPGDRFTALIDIAGFAPGPVVARLQTPGDVFPLDDRATLIAAQTAGPARVARPKSERVLFVQTRSRATFDDSAVARAFEADPSVKIVAVHSETDETRGGTATGTPAVTPGDRDSSPEPVLADVAVFHRTAPAGLTATTRGPGSSAMTAEAPSWMPSLFLDPPEALPAGGLSPAEAGFQGQRRINRIDADHPILAGVSLLGLPATIPARELDFRCRPLAAAGDLTAIAVCDPADPASQSASSPFDPALPHLEARSVVIAFDLDLSPLSQRPDLAALLQNATEWLTAGNTVAAAERAGGLRDAVNLQEAANLQEAINLQEEWATRINDSNLDPVPPGRSAELTRDTRRPWSWRALALAGLLLASIEAITFFRGLTV